MLLPKPAFVPAVSPIITSFCSFGTSCHGYLLPLLIKLCITWQTASCHEKHKATEGRNCVFYIFFSPGLSNVFFPTKVCWVPCNGSQVEVSKEAKTGCPRGLLKAQQTCDSHLISTWRIVVNEKLRSCGEYEDLRPSWPLEQVANLLLVHLSLFYARLNTTGEVHL